MKPNRTRRPVRSRMTVELLEDRCVPATISVADAFAVEGDTTIRPLGAFVSSELGGLSDPYAMILGPDGKLYVSLHNETGGVYRYDAVTGSPLPAPGKTGAEFVSPGSGGMKYTRDIAFGPDGFLYAVSDGTDEVLRYDPTSGAFAGVLVASGAGGLDVPRGLLFHNGYVYVTSPGPYPEIPGPGLDSVLRYDATTGAPAGLSGLPGDAVFISTGSGGLDNPSRLVFGPDGMAYVCSTATTLESSTANSVLRYDGATGAPAGVSGLPGDAVFVSPGSGGLDGPVAMVFRPDGYLYVTSWRNDSVFRYQASTGAFAGTVVPAGSAGLDVPIDLLFEPDGNFLVTSGDTNQVLRFGAGSQAVFTVSLSEASATAVTVDYTTVSGSAASGSDFTAMSGTVTFAPGQTTQTIFVQTVNDGTVESTETFTVNLSNPVGATIADDQAVGTITDDDATKFFVVNDGSTDQTYRYGAPGNGLGNSTLAGGNTAPRGSASTIAGDKVWVVDANKKVYVYDASGTLLGSWTAGSLNAQAQVEGIATNGTDIWLVDAKQDKVFKYTGAATKLSGNQNAASSFSLNSGNKNPKGLVTDGTSFWVVDDSTTNKVFKYNLSGTLLGSWTIDAANASPTGLTINPASVSDLWIVDNGTDKVYQYAAAASRTYGSQSAVATFALAAGNTNPQDIADPPTAEMVLTTASTQDPVAKPRPRPASSGVDAALSNRLLNMRAGVLGMFAEKTTMRHSELIARNIQSGLTVQRASVIADTLFAKARRPATSAMKLPSQVRGDLLPLLGELQSMHRLT